MIIIRILQIPSESVSFCMYVHCTEAECAESGGGRKEKRYNTSIQIRICGGAVWMKSCWGSAAITADSVQALFMEIVPTAWKETRMEHAIQGTAYWEKASCPVDTARIFPVQEYRMIQKQRFSVLFG